MKRRAFLEIGAAVTLSAAPGWPIRRARADWLLVPMDDDQAEHLKAYGLTFRLLERAGKAEWLLNYRGGSFVLRADETTLKDARLSGVTTQGISNGELAEIKTEIQSANMDVIPLEKVPKIAVYVPPNAPPWDDAVTMALEYAGIRYTKVWDAEVIGGKLSKYDWLHLHHEDFTGQYSKFFLNYGGTRWLREMVERNTEMATQLGFRDVPSDKRAVAFAIREFVERGGFLFAMCTATETLDLALASQGVDIAAQFADGTPIDPLATRKMSWDGALAFQDAILELHPAISAYSDIDGHQVNNPIRRQPLGSFTLFNFSAKIDPVATMLVQNHRQVIPDFYGLTTSFVKNRLKPGVIVLADEPGAAWAKYIRGERGKGTWCFLGGHDPEDPQHQIGDAQTDLSAHPHSPGYRLILNNVLFPAAKKKEMKT